jgi:hypothetical protein
MTREQIEKIVDALRAVIKIGYGSVEIVIQDGKILDIVKKERERIN